MPKIRYLFVGSFPKVKRSDVYGGQAFACEALIHSTMINKIDFVLIDSTMESIPPPGFLFRLLASLKRIGSFLKILCFEKIDGILIFTSNGFSFLEKGLMVILGNFFGCRAILMPRSGLLLKEFEKSHFMRFFIPFIFRKCRIVLCQSNKWEKTFRSFGQFPKTMFEVCPNWICEKPYLNISRIPQVQSQHLNLLYLGRIEDYKGVFDLIEAVDRNRNELSDCCFNVCGGGSKSLKLKALLTEKRLSHLFKLHGWIDFDKKLVFLGECEIFVLPSRYEGFPNALLEAMASGLAAIATDVGAVSELIQNHETGLIVRAGDVNALGDAIVGLVKNSEKRHRLGKQAKEQVMSTHGLSKALPKLEKVLYEAAKK